MRFGAIVVLAVAFLASPLASQTDTALDDLAKPFNWPEITFTKQVFSFPFAPVWRMVF